MWRRNRHTSSRTWLHACIALSSAGVYGFKPTPTRVSLSGTRALRRATDGCVTAYLR